MIIGVTLVVTMIISLALVTSFYVLAKIIDDFGSFLIHCVSACVHSAYLVELTFSINLDKLDYFVKLSEK